MMEAWKGKKTGALPWEDSLKEWAMVTNEEIGKRLAKAEFWAWKVTHDKE